GLEHAEVFFNIVFFVSLTSVLIQGSTIPIVARWLNLSLPVADKQRSPVDVLYTEGAHTLLREVIIREDNPTVGKLVMDLNFPQKGIIAMISRNDQFITPSGDTRIEPNDMLIILYENEEILDEIYPILSLDRWEEEEKEFSQFS